MKGINYLLICDSDVLFFHDSVNSTESDLFPFWFLSHVVLKQIKIWLVVVRRQSKLEIIRLTSLQTGIRSDSESLGPNKPPCRSSSRCSTRLGFLSLWENETVNADFSDLHVYCNTTACRMWPLCFCSFEQTKVLQCERCLCVPSSFDC